MKKIKLLTMALLPITTVGATIGMASCSSSTPSLEVIKSKYLLQTNISTVLQNYRNINTQNDFMDIITSSEEVERVRGYLRDKNVTELKILRGYNNLTDGIYQPATTYYKTIVSNISSSSLGFNQVKVEVAIKMWSYQYTVSYKDSTGLSKELNVEIESPIIEKKVYECIYQFEGMYDFPTDGARFV